MSHCVTNHRHMRLIGTQGKLKWGYRPDTVDSQQCAHGFCLEFPCFGHVANELIMSFSHWRLDNRTCMVLPVKYLCERTLLVTGCFSSEATSNTELWYHYIDVIMRWRFKSPTSPLFTQPSNRTQIKENIKAPRHCALCGEFTVDSTHKWPVTRKIFPFDDAIKFFVRRPYKPLKRLSNCPWIGTSWRSPFSAVTKQNMYIFQGINCSVITKGGLSVQWT